MLGHGFYTIGPCGEEALSAAGLCLEPTDSLALHSRHAGIQLGRQLASSYCCNDNDGDNDVDDSNRMAVLKEYVINRAMGYTGSALDSVTGGVHCSVGGSSTSSGLLSLEDEWQSLQQQRQQQNQDFVVTSTLASQCPGAVGRALAYGMKRRILSLQQKKKNGTTAKIKANDNDNHERRWQIHRPVSMVTIGDGSVHNSHFWSTFHLARHARHLGDVPCPVVFGISDNGWSISYPTKGYVDTLFANKSIVPVFNVNVNDMMDVYSQTTTAMKYARQESAPVVLLYKDLVRRFGHAATDRQNAYMSSAQIQTMAGNPVL